MARIIRALCASCKKYVDAPPADYLITEPVMLNDYDEFERGIYMFTCPHCGYVNTKETTPKIEELLRLGGVLTTEELEQWLVDELTGEL